MAQSDSGLYRRTLWIRVCVYGHQDLWHGYFTVRGREWNGDKAAVRYLLAEDPAYLEVFERFLAAEAVEQKLALYRELAALATAPAGGLWARGATTMNRPSASSLWQDLMSDGERSFP
jgi:hypothetical protein